MYLFIYMFYIIVCYVPANRFGILNTCCNWHHLQYEIFMLSWVVTKWIWTQILS